MKKRRSFTKTELVQTLDAYLRSQRWTQIEFVRWLDTKGITISAQYLNDVLHRRRDPGPKLIQVFEEITGIRLVDGLIEE